MSIVIVLEDGSSEQSPFDVCTSMIHSCATGRPRGVQVFPWHRTVISSNCKKNMHCMQKLIWMIITQLYTCTCSIYMSVFHVNFDITINITSL